MSGAFLNCKTVLVTGANRGLGLQIVESLVTGGCSPGKIIATARSPGEAKVNSYPLHYREKQRILFINIKYQYLYQNYYPNTDTDEKSENLQ